MTASVFVTALGWTLVNFLWQGALVGCATAVGLTALRNGSPQQRYLLACGALLSCLAWPAFELWSRLGEPGAAGGAEDNVARLVLHGVGSAGTGWIDAVQANLGWIVGVWAACAAALALRMAVGLLWIGRMARHDEPARDWQLRLDRIARHLGVTRAIRLRVVDSLASPVTAGWWRPVVLVPASLLSGMSPELLEALLAHEIAHVRRFDYLVNLAQNVVEAVLFYHPAVWWISHRIRTEREQVADDLAAKALGEPRRLALALSELERLQFSTHHLAQAASGGDLMSRIKRLVRPDRQALNWKAAIPVLGLVALCAGCAASRQQTAQSQQAQQQPAPQLADSRAVVEFKSCHKPVWPVEDLRAGHEGTVTLGYLIDAAGNVVDSTVRKSSGYPAMDEAARSGIAKCHFKPATRNGEPVQAWMQMQYVWVLH